MEKINLNEIIDFQTALDGEIKYQKEWIEFYDKQEGEAKGKRMITAPDIYRAGKENSNVCESLREDFNYRWVATGTTILYNKDSFSGRVIHNFSSIVAKPIDISVSEIPVYQSQQIKKVVEGKGLAYVQALFNTKDNANEIISTLEKISQTGAEDICFWTP